MTYNINKTDGSALITPTMPNGQLLDGTSDTTTGLTLIGRNYTGYGQVQNENFISLLQNFAKDTPPTENQATLPLTGTLWWDTSTKLLKVYNGSAFIQINGRIASATAPTATNIGDQWWDTTNGQLCSWTGSTWALVGPGYTTAQGKSGAMVETLYDQSSNPQTVVNTYTNGNLISITSFNTAFTPNVVIGNFPRIISPGITISNTEILTGNVTNSQTVGGFVPTVFARQDISQTFARDVGVTGNLVLTNANISFANQSLILQNKNLSGNLEIYVNVPIVGNTKPIWVDGSTGRVLVSTDPVDTNGVATKNYIDTSTATFTGLVNSVQTQLTGFISGNVTSLNSNLNSTITTLSSNLASVQSEINSNVNLLTANTAANIVAITSQFGNIFADLNYLQSEIVTLAPIDSPQFTGDPRVPQVPSLTSFLNNVNVTQKPYLLNLTTPISGNIGDTITRLDGNTHVPFGTFTIHGNAVSNSSVVKVTIATGSVTVGPQTISSFIQINGNEPIPVSYISNIQFLGPELDYLGLGDNSANVASTSYVDVTANILYQDYNVKITSLAASTAANLATAIAPMATTNSPAFTGTPTAPTPPVGDVTGNIATTAFVTQAITAQKFNYTVASTPPVGGADGDFWFVVG